MRVFAWENPQFWVFLHFDTVTRKAARDEYAALVLQNPAVLHGQPAPQIDLVDADR